METTLRTCTKCGEAKPETAQFFSRHKTCKLGLATACKVCAATYLAEYHAKTYVKKREQRPSQVESPIGVGVGLPLTQGHIAIIDECDADLCNSKWCAGKRRDGQIEAIRNSGTRKNTVRHILHRTIYERVINRHLESWELVDHWNGNTLDNRRENLRLATFSQNAQNSKLYKTSQTGYKGVHFHKASGKWRASITHNYKEISLGYFHDPITAYKAYCDKAAELFGEFARFE